MRMQNQTRARLSARALLALAVALLAGCGSIGTLPADTTGAGADESVLVFGVSPADYRVMFFPGTYEGGKFRPAPATGIATVISDVPHDGYVVARAKAGQVLALGVVTAPRVGASGGQYHACGGSNALVVEVPRGRVVYVTDMEFAPQGARLDVRYSQRIGPAREHLRRSFPRLKGEVGQLEPKIVATANDCTTTPGSIIIYMRR